MRIRVFRGDSTRQVDGVSGASAAPGAYYWEPKDYDGDVLWSPAYVSLTDAMAAAAADKADIKAAAKEKA